MMLQIAGASSMLAGRIRMTFIVPHKLKCPQRRQRGHDLLATTAIAAQGICWITGYPETIDRAFQLPDCRQSSHNFLQPCSGLTSGFATSQSLTWYQTVRIM